MLAYFAAYRLTVGSKTRLSKSKLILTHTSAIPRPMRTENQLHADVMSRMCRPREHSSAFAMRGRLMRTRHGLCSPYLRSRRLPPQDLRLLSSYLADCLKVTSTPHQGRGAALYSACPAVRMSGRRDDDEAGISYPGYCSKARKVSSTFGQCRIHFNGH